MTHKTNFLFQYSRTSFLYKKLGPSATSIKHYHNSWAPAGMGKGTLASMKCCQMFFLFCKCCL